jgi:lipoyl(octanoyl) transferase
MNELSIKDCQQLPYRQALDLQIDLCQKRQDQLTPNTVLLVEHPPVITLGARQSENRLLKTENELKESGISVEKVRRGGGTTAHNPGQIVIYPILDLKSLHLDITTYIRQLEQIGIELLNELGVTASRKKSLPGLWIGEKKIASIGVKVKKWVTYHGIAINICNDLSIFENIIPCGLDGVEMTSVEKETSNIVSIEKIKQILIPILNKLWNNPSQR